MDENGGRIMKGLKEVLYAETIGQDDMEYCCKKFREFLEAVVTMRSAQKDYQKLKYSPDTIKRVDAQEKRREIERQIDRMLDDVYFDEV